WLRALRRRSGAQHRPGSSGTQRVETVEDLADVKSVVVEAVRSGGCSVLNADDPLTAAMAERAGGRIFYFSMLPSTERPPFLRTHITEGRPAAVLHGTGPAAEIVIHG